VKWVWLAALLVGCAGAEVVEAPVVTYEDVVRARVEAAAEVTPHTLRYNPTTCRCPDFEIRLGAHWQRVELAVDDPEDPVLVALLEAARAATDQVGRTYAVDGSLAEVIGTCRAGTRFVTLEAREFQGALVKQRPESGP